MSEYTLPQGAFTIAGAVVIGVSLMGFMRATDVDDYDFETPLHHAAAAVDVGEFPVARSYREMRDSPRGPGSGFDTSLEKLAAQLPSRLDDVSLAGTSKATDLADRASRRAFFGAPPVIPHPVRQRSQAECMACHQEGLMIASKKASMVPHEAYTSCTQCHSMAAPDLPWAGKETGLADDPRVVPNSFVGLDAPVEGPRWNSTAPPVIPHDEFMHERCASCHGVAGRNALRSTHPSRQSCQQCHAPQSALEQRPGGRR